eukprot:scaffold113657_cov22-Tisochrysis_lutea.AAC.1
MVAHQLPHLQPAPTLLPTPTLITRVAAPAGTETALLGCTDPTALVGMALPPSPNLILYLTPARLLRLNHDPRLHRAPPAHPPLSVSAGAEQGFSGSCRDGWMPWGCCGCEDCCPAEATCARTVAAATWYAGAAGGTVAAAALHAGAAWGTVAAAARYAGAAGGIVAAASSALGVVRGGIGART